MAATAIHQTSFLIRPTVTAPEFIPFDPSRLALKRPRTRHRKYTPQPDPSPHIPWTHTDDIDTEEAGLAGRELGSRSPEHQFPLTITHHVDKTQSDTGGESGSAEREGDGNGSRSTTPLGMREDGASDNHTALKGSSLDKPFVIEDDGSENDFEAGSEAELEDEELPSIASLFKRARGPKHERGNTQAHNSAQLAPGAMLSVPRAEATDDDLDPLFEGNSLGDGDNDDDDDDNNGTADKRFVLGLADAELGNSPLRHATKGYDGIIVGQAHDSARQGDQVATVLVRAMMAMVLDALCIVGSDA